MGMGLEAMQVGDAGEREESTTYTPTLGASLLIQP